MRRVFGCLVGACIVTSIAGWSPAIAQTQRVSAQCQRVQGQVACDVRTDQTKQINDITAMVAGKPADRVYEPFDRVPKITAYYMLIQQSAHPKDAARIIERIAEKSDTRRNYGIALFSDKLIERAALGANASAIQAVKNDKDLFKADGKHDLYKMANEAAEKLARFPADRRALVLFADGRVTAYDKRDRDQLIKFASDKNILIYTVYLKTSAGDAKTLADLRSETSGIYLESVDCTERRGQRCDSVDLSNDATRDFHLYLERGGKLVISSAVPNGSELAITANFTDGSTARADRVPCCEMANQSGSGSTEQWYDPALRWVSANPVLAGAAGAVGLGGLLLALSMIARRAPANGYDGTTEFDPQTRRNVSGTVAMSTETVILTPTHDRDPLQPSQIYAWLQFLDADSRRVPIGGTNVRIGRGKDNDIILNNKTVHRQHALIKRSPDGRFSIHHLGGENVVVVNSERSTQHDLADNDMIELGEVRMRFFVNA